VNHDEAQRRMFDLNGLTARCTFRESKQANEFVDHLVNSTRLENEQSPNNLLENRELVNDKDLFVINMVLVDPCWVIAPAKYKNGCLQCFETINHKTGHDGNDYFVKKSVSKHCEQLSLYFGGAITRHGSTRPTFITNKSASSTISRLSNKLLEVCSFSR